jgi:hypothetical protein
MEAMKLFRLLQDHVGVLNKMAVDLYNGNIDAATVEVQAKEKLTQTLAAMNDPTISTLSKKG